MRHPFFLFVGMLLLAGCATGRLETVKPPVSPVMSTSYAGGTMNITWDSEPGERYTIYYTDALRGTRPDWKPLPQATDLKGTGKTVQVTDEADRGTKRRYLLLTGDQKP
jgi:hypothetical protein